MISGVAWAPTVPAYQIWVAMVHKAGGQQLPEKPDLQHAQESTGVPGKKQGCY